MTKKRQRAGMTDGEFDQLVDDGFTAPPKRTRRAQEDFWTGEEWAVLAPLSQKERFDLMLRVIFSGRGLLGQADFEREQKAVAAK